jgi:glycosyltransferase involved in cell wall biosynthesis
MSVNVSIIIPTFNEEKYLPHLLDSIKNQSSPPAEIIIADGPSIDKTKEIALSYGCKVVDGGNHPGIGRNRGAQIATQPLLLFIDSDGYLTPNFLEKNIAEFEKRNLDIGTCYTTTDSKNPMDQFAGEFVNFYYNITQKILPHVYGNYIFSKKTNHEKLGGFDESLYLGEDHDYVARAVKHGAKYAILNSEKGVVSLRRYRSKGRFKTILIYIYIEVHRIFAGGIKRKQTNFAFGQHDK